jgi:ribose transport system permease protein
MAKAIPSSGWSNRFGAIQRASWLPAAVTSLVLLLAGGILSPGYASWGNLNQILAGASILMFAAAGQTLVMISGDYGIDLSVGQVMSLSAVLAYAVLDGSDARLPLALGAVLLVGAALGLLNGLGVVWAGLPPLVMTLGTLVIAQGIVFASAQGGTPEGGVAPLLGDLTSRNVAGVRWVVFLAILFVVAVEIVLRKTRYGRMLYLIGTNREAARLSGVPVGRYVILTFVLSGMCGAFAGMVLLGYAGTANLDLGGGYLILSIAAVVIGGTSLAGGSGNYLRTAVGSITLVILTTFLLSVGISEAVRQVITGALLFVLLAFNARSPRLRQ